MWLTITKTQKNIHKIKYKTTKTHTKLHRLLNPIIQVRLEINQKQTHTNQKTITTFTSDSLLDN